MAVQQPPSEPVYSCPNCDGPISFAHQAWQCEECGHAPRHAAD